MVRNRASRVVMSQRDVRQTSQTEQLEQDIVSLSQPCPTSMKPGSPTSKCCTWCHLEGKNYACLAESTHAHCEICHGPSQPASNWTASVTATEGWVPASGPCCEDCLEVALEGHRKSEVGKQGRELMDSVQTWCCHRGEELRFSLHLGWKHVLHWLQQTKEKLRPQNMKEQNSAWDNIQYQGEGFLEVKVLVCYPGVQQHLEIDFPTEVPIHVLKEELATLINISPEAQSWYHLNTPVDETKTLEELHVEIGAIIEVKCQI